MDEVVTYFTCQEELILILGSQHTRTPFKCVRPLNHDGKHFIRKFYDNCILDLQWEEDHVQH